MDKHPKEITFGEEPYFDISGVSVFFILGSADLCATEHTWFIICDWQYVGTQTIPIRVLKHQPGMWKLSFVLWHFDERATSGFVGRDAAKSDSLKQIIKTVYKNLLVLVRFGGPTAV